MKQILIIPDIKNITDSLRIVKQYNLGFEYNDFFYPDVIDDEGKLTEIISLYKKQSLPDFCTMHGDFFDVIPFSMDEKIRRVSDIRIKQSIDIARKMGARSVVFHTNYNPFLNTTSYIESFVKTNIEYWSMVLKEHPDINIYLENMFDTTPDVLKELSEGLKMYDNYGVCLDYAHVAISPVEPDIWAKQLGEYIKHIHINDNDKKRDLHMPWGDGLIDRIGFYRNYEKYMNKASVLIETNSVGNQERSLEVLAKDGFIDI